MNSLRSGWSLGGSVALRLAATYIALAALIFYLQSSRDHWVEVWNPEQLVIVRIVGNNALALLTFPLLILIPLGLAWLTGSVSGFMTGMLSPLLGNRQLARWWGMFCFFVPSLIFHNAANLRPRLILGEHWLNTYWFWIGLPSLIAIFVGGWVGERLSEPQSRAILN